MDYHLFRNNGGDSRDWKKKWIVEEGIVTYKNLLN